MNNIKVDTKAVCSNNQIVHLKSQFSKKSIGKMQEYDISVINNSGKDLAIDRIELFRYNLCVKSIEIFRQGFYMPSDPVGFHMLDAGKKVSSPGGWEKKHLTEWEMMSHSMVVISMAKDDNKTILGFSSFNNFEGYFVFNTDGVNIEVSAWCDLEGITLKNGASLELETFIIAEEENFNNLLENYADYIGKKNSARIPTETVTGWIDWQYYREDKCEADVLRTMHAMKKLTNIGYPLKYIVIDGGWCNFASEWLEASEKFPSGMQQLSKIIKSNGFELGLWLAPYLTNINTKVAQEHPEWMVIDKKTGKPLYKPSSNVGPCYVVDFTVPEALEWMRNIVKIMVKDWKIGYLKLDGPNLAHYEGGVFHDPQITTIQQTRRSLEVIREACGDDIIIEGEGIYGASIGFVDTQRTTQDNQPYWHFPDTGEPSMRENLKNDLLSAFTHNKFWHNHRENVIIRDFLSPFHARIIENNNIGLKDSMLTENEIAAQITACSLAGGALLLTDPVEELLRNPQKIKLISQFLPHYDVTAKPLDTFLGGKQPSIFQLPVIRSFENWHIIGIFNWSDKYENFNVPLDQFISDGEWHAFEFFEEKYLGSFKSEIPVNDIPAHSCRLIAVRKKEDRPQLLGTNMHLYQGAVDIDDVNWKNGKLKIKTSHFYQHESSIFVGYPDNYCFDNIESNAKDFIVDSRKKNILKIQFNGKKRTSFTLKWNTI